MEDMVPGDSSPRGTFDGGNLQLPVLRGPYSAVLPLPARLLEMVQLSRLT